MKRVVQPHHISYKPEVIVNVWKGEHMLLSRLAWFTRTSVSKGLIVALKVFIAVNEGRAIDIELEK